MFGFHAPELIIILVIALLIFGPKKLPEMGSSIGKSIKEFRKGMNEITHPKEEEDVKPYTPPTPSYSAIERESMTRQANAGFESVAVEKEVVTKPISEEMSRVETHVD
jgi:sec-independent protein translocase protein TatA